MQGGLTYEHGQLAINSAARMIGGATEKRKVNGDVILDGETDEDLKNVCESIINGKYPLKQ